MGDDLEMTTKETEAITLTWEALTYTVQVKVEQPDPNRPGKTIKVDQPKILLNRVSGAARAGRVLAIMGPSGAGKTTFLNTIAGRIAIDKEHVVDGCAFLNNVVMSDAYKSLISFVAQDDIVMGKETPREALYFTYRMRTGSSDEVARAKTERMLEKLHLMGAADTTLGIPGLVKGVSGGEKKRTNIGSELIRNPRVMILDEPTTGLDSVNAERVGQLLRQLAYEEQRTVLCTIHSPSSELFAVFDDVMLLAKGRIAYHGSAQDAPAYFSKLGYVLPPRYNPSEFYMKLLQLPEKELTPILDAWDAYLLSEQSATNLSMVPVTGALEEDPVLRKHASENRAGTGLQLNLLTKRALRLYARDPASTFGRLVQTLFFSILMGLFYFGLDSDSAGVQDRQGALFMVAVNTVFLSVMSGVATFPPERAVFLMEQTNELYSPWVYFFSKTFAETPFQIFFPVLYTVIFYFMVGLHNTAEAFFIFLFLIILVANTSYSFGLLAASFFSSAEVAMAFVPLVILPMFVVGGLFANSDRLDPAWLWLNYISFIRYAYTSLCDIEFSRIGTLCAAGQSCRFQNGDEVLAFMGFSDEKWWINAIILMGFNVGFRLLAACGLWYQGNMLHSKMAFTKNVARRSPQAVSPRHVIEAEGE